MDMNRVISTLTYLFLVLAAKDIFFPTPQHTTVERTSSQPTSNTHHHSYDDTHDVSGDYYSSYNAEPTPSAQKGDRPQGGVIIEDAQTHERLRTKFENNPAEEQYQHSQYDQYGHTHNHHGGRAPRYTGRDGVMVLICNS
eukprot:TRINITY_DN5104_c0_g2_i1.p2 TRINITY_DN5104_c0_g2~~TRINITY_DN5104_c0_g2_i1.p2  ORF type:complete len:140 (-),score=9.78 TRINITY_DN5104_c0_g2_i1:244-663(-)